MTDAEYGRGGLLPPADCGRILIVGAGGFGREVLQWIRHAWPAHADRIGGFLSADPGVLDGHAHAPAIVGSPESFMPAPGDGLVLAIGIPGARRKVAEQLESRGGRFLSLVHPLAFVAETAVIGTGAVICPGAIVSDSARVGRFALLNYHSSLGHDAQAGDFAVLSPYAALGGAARIDDDVFLGLHASVGPGKRVGPRSRVSANSAALADAAPDALVFGVPGRVRPLVSTDAENGATPNPS